MAAPSASPPVPPLETLNPPPNLALKASIFCAAICALIVNTHYYRTGLCSRPFVPAVFGPGTIGDFCPGSNG